MILTLSFQLQLFNSFEFPPSLSKCFCFTESFVLLFFCVHTCMLACVCVRVCVGTCTYVCMSFATRRMFQFWFQFSFPFFFFFFISLKLFFLLETSSPGNQLTSHHAAQAAAIFFKPRWFSLTPPNRNSSGWPWKAGVSPCLAGGPGGGEGPSATMEVSDCGTQSDFCFLPVF